MDFLDDFVQATSHAPSPRVFRYWAGVAAVAAVLGRKVYTYLGSDDPAYANQYIALVSDAAGGKSTAIKYTRRLLQAFPHNVQFSGDIPTPQAAIEAMGKWFTGDDDTPAKSYNFLTGEIAGLFVDPTQIWWFQAICQCWDCEDEIKRPTKTQGVDIIQQPYVNLLVGAQPYWFADGWPKNINELGLPSRILYVHSGEEMKPNYRAKQDKAAWERARQSLLRIQRAKGEVRVAPDVVTWMEDWVEAGKPPHVNMSGLSKAYDVRRPHHLAKLSLLVAMSRHPDRLIITMDDLVEARRALFEIEPHMHKAMSLAGGNSYLPKERAVVDWVREEYVRTGQPVPEGAVRGQAARYFTPNMRSLLIEDLVGQRQLRTKITPGGRVYLPGENS